MGSCGEFSLLKLYRSMFNGTLYEFKGFQPVSISVSFCDLGVELAGRKTTYVYSQRQS